MNPIQEGQIFTPKEQKLKGLLEGIEDCSIVLPNFQRPWVWEPELIRELIISVANWYPAGSLLTMPIVDDSFLAIHPFEGADQNSSARPMLMVLDGQQRLTSLYQALYSKNGVVIRNGKRDRIYHFYLDVDLLMRSEDQDKAYEDSVFEKALFYVRENQKGKRERYEGLRPLYEITTFDQEVAAGALPLNVIFGLDKGLKTWQDSYLWPPSDDAPIYLLKEKLDKWDSSVSPWLDRIWNYPFPVIELHRNVPLAAICHIFEKVNSMGVPLSVFDLCTAILWTQGFHLNEKWEETRSALERRVPMQDLQGVHFLQGLSLLDSLARKQSSSGAPVAVTCRKQDLMIMRHDAVERWWETLSDAYLESARFMADQGVISQKILPYSTLIVPLSAIFGYLISRKGNVIVGAAWPKIERWYWCSVFSHRYSATTETISAQDLEQVIRWVDGGDQPDVVRTFTFRPDQLQEITSIRNVTYKGILCLLARKGARDFGGGGKLTTSLFYETQQDHHHIFPSKALERINIDDPRADTIVNKTLIGETINRSIGGKLPSQYLSTLRHKLEGSLFDEILKTHLIEPAYLEKDDWIGFLDNRKEQLTQLVESVCVSKA
ncbi:MAG: DUF262 domain-containing protein [Halobacteriota archaeon]|jgi:hypothetical protein